MQRRFPIPCALLLLGAAATPQDRAWTEREAEHLLCRAGFGARSEEIQEAVAAGRERTVERLLAGPDFIDDPFYAKPLVRRLYAMEGMDEEERREVIRDRRRADRRQLDDFLSWWVERMVDGRDPLRERMTLFWHGHFTSSFDKVRDSYDMILQNQLYRTRGLGSFEDLLHGVLRDPAMLDYLDNDTNRWESPNENLARELLELFTLGEGNYGEDDVREVARALTGWTVRSGAFRVVEARHDPDAKEILGRTGRFDGNDVVGILLEQDACARYLSGRILSYFEGVEPDPERVEEYATVLRESGYEIRPVLRRLFLDERFYRDEVVGTRIASPIDFLVGSARRLGVRPPGRFLVVGAGVLGEHLFHPPNVKGWDGGEAWITTSSLMQRSNLIGILLGVLDVDDYVEDVVSSVAYGEPMTAMEEGPKDSMAATVLDAEDARTVSELVGPLRSLRGMSGVAVRGRLNLSSRLERAGIHEETDAVDHFVDMLIVGDVDASVRRELARVLADERRAAGLTRAEFFQDPYPGEEILRGLAHLILSLPEAQLH